MSNIKKILVTLCLTLMLTGCFSQSFRVGEGEPVSSQKGTQIFIFWGIGQHKGFDSAAICNGVDNVVKVDTSLPIIGGLVGLVTAGIVVPYRYEVYCS